jgi:Flp pilus assembly protein TadD
LDWDWAGAEADYNRATALNPNCEAAHRSYAQFLSAMGRHEEALAETDRAVELDPLCLVVNASEACVQYFAGRLDEALVSSRRVSEMDPKFSLAHRLLGAAYLELGRPDDAVGKMERAVEIEGRQPVPLAWLGHALGVAGRLDDGRAVLTEVEQLATERYVSPYRLALIHTGLGDIDAMFHGLQQACDKRAVGLVNVAAEPRFTALCADPRYHAMLRRMGLETGPPSGAGYIMHGLPAPSKRI